MKKLLVLVMAVLSSQVGCAQKTENKTEMSIQNSNSIVIQQLEKFKAQDHFAGDGQLYTGVQNSALRMSLNQKVADTAQAFIALFINKRMSQPRQNFYKSLLMELVKSILTSWIQKIENKWQLHLKVF